MVPAPDPLAKAFNDAIKPYIEQIENLRNELEDMAVQVQQLEDERADMHAWIDKRGLRAGESTRPFPFNHGTRTNPNLRCPAPDRYRHEPIRPLLRADPQLSY